MFPLERDDYKFNLEKEIKTEQEINDKRKIESILVTNFAYNVENDRVINDIYEIFSNRLKPFIMQWQTRDEPPLPKTRIVIFSPIYPKESEMRKRIIDSQFLDICREATHWSYISEPSI